MELHGMPVRREVVGHLLEVGGEREPRLVLVDKALAHRTFIGCTREQAQAAGAFLFERVKVIADFRENKLASHGQPWDGTFISLEKVEIRDTWEPR